MSIKRLLIVLVSTFSLLGTALAQQPPAQHTETGLALEITTLKGRAPVYLRLPGPNMPISRAWYGGFGHIAGWEPPAGTQPIFAVRIVPSFDVDRVKIAVSVLRGAKFDDTEEPVATYFARENDRLTIAELKDFGVEPFEIKIVRVTPEVTDLPTVLNQTKSLEVVSIEPLVSNFPLYKLTLRNLSDKNISGLSIETLVGGVKKQSHMPQSRTGKSLIAAGDFFELKEPLSTQAVATADGYAPATAQTQQIVIATLVFEDGSYEGDPKSAASLRGFAAGSKTELTRLVPVLESALAMSDSLENLRRQLNDVSVAVDSADVAALSEAFPGIESKRLQLSLEAATHGVKRDVLKELDSFEKSRHQAGEYQTWLTNLKGRYADWLARLSSNDIAKR